MSGQAGSAILSTYFQLAVVDDESGMPAGNYENHFARKEQKRRRWLAPRLTALRSRVDPLIASGFPLESLLDLDLATKTLELTSRTATDDGSATITFVCKPARALDDAEAVALRAAFVDALASPQTPPVDVVDGNFTFEQDKPFYIYVQTTITGLDNACAAELRTRFDTATRNIRDGLAAESSLDLIRNGPDVRIGDGHTHIELVRGWLAITVLSNDSTKRKRVVAVIDRALEGYVQYQ